MKNIFSDKNFKPLKNMCPQSFSVDVLDMLNKYLDTDFERWEEERRERARRSYVETVKLDPYRLKILLFYENALFRMKYDDKVYELLLNERKKDMAIKKINEHVSDKLTAKEHKKHPIKKIDIQSRIDEVRDSIDINNSINDLFNNIKQETEEQNDIHQKSSNQGDDNEGYIQKNISSSKYQKQKTESNKLYVSIVSWIYYSIVIAIFFNYIIQMGIKSIFSIKILSIMTIVLLIPDIILPYVYNHMIIPIYFNVMNMITK